MQLLCVQLAVSCDTCPLRSSWSDSARRYASASPQSHPALGSKFEVQTGEWSSVQLLVSSPVVHTKWSLPRLMLNQG